MIEEQTATQSAGTSLPSGVLTAVLEAMGDAVLVYDRWGQVRYANASARALLGPEDDAGEGQQAGTASRLPVVRGADGRPLEAQEWPLHLLLEGCSIPGHAPHPLEVYPNVGQARHVQVSGLPLRSSEGRVSGALVFLHDMTELRRLEDAEQKAQQRMDDLVMSTGHQLRTPLTVFMASLQLAREQVATAIKAGSTTNSEAGARLARVQQLLGRIDNQANRMNRLISGLLDTVGIKQGRLVLHLAPCDLAAITREVVDEINRSWPGRTVELHVPDNGRALPVMADADRLGQVIWHYLSNALQHGPLDAPIVVTLRRQPTAVRLEVHDEGPGIAGADQRRVWRRFYQVTPRAHLGGATPGMGLGLYISRAVIKRHGGRVGIVSTRGHGTTFWLTLPYQRGALEHVDGGAPGGATGPVSR